MAALRVEDIDFLDEDFVEAEEPQGFTRVPNGDYVQRICAVRPSIQDGSGIPQVEWEFVIEEGEFEGCHTFLRNVLKDKKAVGWFKKTLRTCEVDIDAADFKVSEFLVNGLDELLDLVVLTTVKNRKYTNADGEEKEAANVYINEVIWDEDIEDGPGDHDASAAKSEPEPEAEPPVEQQQSGAKSRRPRPTSTQGRGSVSGGKKKNIFAEE